MGGYGTPMVYERRVASFKELLAEVKGLATDEGVRIEGRYRDEKCLIFVTRHSGKYALWLSSKRRRDGVQGRIDEFKDFIEFRLLERFLRGVISEPFRAYIY